jgi:hypothetical protein
MVQHAGGVNLAPFCVSSLDIKRHAWSCKRYRLGTLLELLAIEATEETSAARKS